MLNDPSRNRVAKENDEMSHLSIELHENFPYERIEEREYEIVRNEMAAIGCSDSANQAGKDVRLPRGCYFGGVVSEDKVRSAWQNIARRLNRPVSLEYTEGTSFGFGLKPVLSLTKITEVLTAKPMRPLSAPIPPLLRLLGKV